VTIDCQSSGRGLTVDDSDGVTLEGCTLRDVGGYGLKLQFADGLGLADVHAVENGRTGIELNTTDDPKLSNRETPLWGVDRCGGNERECVGGLALWPIDNDNDETVIAAEITGSSFTDEPVGVVAQNQGDFAVRLENNDIENDGVGLPEHTENPKDDPKGDAVRGAVDFQEYPANRSWTGSRESLCWR
jgi:hypothetical protein